MKEIKLRACYDGKMQYFSLQDVFYQSGLQENFQASWLHTIGATLEVDKDNIKIMLSTTLLDKNGKEIYEGDIVNIKNTFEGDTLIRSYNGNIYFENGSFNVTGEASFDTLAVNNSYWEVIGNIYENPELMEIK